ncbi:MAG TPA: hypothetical protein VGC74_05285 [Stenotrophomonas sp.]|jgi:hypothetical protein
MKQQDDKTGSTDGKNDDVGRLFDKLGSAGAGLYQEFEPNRLPPLRQALQNPADKATEPAVPQPPPLAAVRSLRPEPPVAPVPMPTPVATGAGQTPLDQMFQRLLQAEVAAPSSGVLKRMFGR